MEEEEEPNLGKLIDQTLEQVYWNRTKDKKVLRLDLIFKRHTLAIYTQDKFIRVELVEQ